MITSNKFTSTQNLLLLIGSFKTLAICNKHIIRARGSVYSLMTVSS